MEIILLIAFFIGAAYLQSFANQGDVEDFFESKKKTCVSIKSVSKEKYGNGNALIRDTSSYYIVHTKNKKNKENHYLVKKKSFGGIEIVREMH